MPETGRLMDVQATYQRFGELIIEECLAQLIISDLDLDEDFDKGIAWSARQIKQHFGVE